MEKQCIIEYWCKAIDLLGIEKDEIRLYAPYMYYIYYHKT